VIRSFKDRETARIWNRAYSKKLPGDIQERALMKLQQLHAANGLRDLATPASNRLEALKGDRAGEYSIRINKQWRICCKGAEGKASEVEIADYH
jgi:proteic killer suppression protein